MILFIIIMVIPIAIFALWLDGYLKKKKNDEECQEGREKFNSIFSTKIKHICGLPLAENSDCILHLCNDEIVIDGTGSIMRLQKSRILDMNIKTSKEVQNSISGAVGGAMLLGPIGAFLAGSSTEFHRFFIIIYKNKENVEQCISFDMGVDTNALKGIYDYIEEFKNNITEKEEIEL